MARKAKFSDREIVLDFYKLVRQICDEKNLTLKQLETLIDAGKGSFSQIRPVTEHHYRMFKKLFRLYPMALFDDPTDPRGLHLWALSLRESLPREFQSEFWEAVREATEETATKGPSQHSGDTQRAKPRKKKRG